MTTVHQSRQCANCAHADPDFECLQMVFLAGGSKKPEGFGCHEHQTEEELLAGRHRPDGPPLTLVKPTTTPQDSMRAGRCPDCGRMLHHGSWADDEMQAAAEDIGMPVDEFRDCCDDCFVALCGGDARHAQTLASRPLMLKPEPAP